MRCSDGESDDECSCVACLECRVHGDAAIMERKALLVSQTGKLKIKDIKNWEDWKYTYLAVFLYESYSHLFFGGVCQTLPIDLGLT